MPLHRNESSSLKTMNMKNMDVFVKEKHMLSRERGKYLFFNTGNRTQLVVVWVRLCNPPEEESLPVDLVK